MELREVAENHNWEIVQEYVDAGVSGAKTSRPQLDAMMKDAFSRKFEMVLTLELSRVWVGTPNTCWRSVERLKEKSIDLYIHNQQIDTSTAYWDVCSSLLRPLSSAEFERDLIAETSEVWCIANCTEEETEQDMGSEGSRI